MFAAKQDGGHACKIMEVPRLIGKLFATSGIPRHCLAGLNRAVFSPDLNGYSILEDSGKSHGSTFEKYKLETTGFARALFLETSSLVIDRRHRWVPREKSGNAIKREIKR